MMPDRLTNIIYIKNFVTNYNTPFFENKLYTHLDLRESSTNLIKSFRELTFIISSYSNLMLNCFSISDTSCKCANESQSSNSDWLLSKAKS